MTYPEGSELVKRLIRIENQIEALRRAEIIILEELNCLYHRGTITEGSAERLLSQLNSLKTLKPK